jgi:hypothetical protein
VCPAGRSGVATPPPPLVGAPSHTPQAPPHSPLPPPPVGAPSLAHPYHPPPPYKPVPPPPHPFPPPRRCAPPPPTPPLILHSTPSPGHLLPPGCAPRPLLGPARVRGDPAREHRPVSPWSLLPGGRCPALPPGPLRGNARHGVRGLQRAVLPRVPLPPCLQHQHRPALRGRAGVLPNWQRRPRGRPSWGVHRGSLGGGAGRHPALPQWRLLRRWGPQPLSRGQVRVCGPGQRPGVQRRVQRGLPLSCGLHLKSRVRAPAAWVGKWGLCLGVGKCVCVVGGGMPVCVWLRIVRVCRLGARWRTGGWWLVATYRHTPSAPGVGGGRKASAIV